MTMSRAALAILFGTALMGCGNSGSGSAPAGSGAPAAGNSGAPQAAGNGKLVHQKVTKGGCTFEFDAPEQLTPTGKDDGMSTAVRSASFEFMGYHNSSVYGLEQLKALSLMGRKDTVLVAETASDKTLVVTRSAEPSSDPVRFIVGHGEEPRLSGRDLGCSYLCWGTKEKETDAVAMCKSVRIQYKEPPAQ